MCQACGCAFLSRGALCVSGVCVCLPSARPFACVLSLRLVAPCGPVRLCQCVPGFRGACQGQARICGRVSGVSGGGGQGVGQVFEGAARARGQTFEQVFEKKTDPFLALFCQNFQPNPDRILNRIRTESQPNLDRISESLSLIVEPNPNRMSKPSQDFILLTACCLGGRCRICEQGLMGC